MSRKRLTALAVGCMALLATSAAVASYKHAQSTQQVTVSFAATTVANSHTLSCTGADGSYRDTNATYTGTAGSSNTALDGPLVIKAHSVVDTTSGLGWLDGSFKIKGGDGQGNLEGTIRATVVDGKLGGAVNGDLDSPNGKLIATVAGSFDQTGGFSNGSLGNGDSTEAAIVFERGSCTKENAKHVRTVSVAHLSFKTEPGLPVVTRKGSGKGSFTLDVTRDSTGAITSAKAVFYVNYLFNGGSETITGLTLRNAASGDTGPVALDSGLSTFTDDDGSGNVTQVVASVPADTAKAVLANPKQYYVELTASDTALRAQLDRFSHQ